MKIQSSKIKTQNYNSKFKTFLVLSCSFAFLVLSFQFAVAVSPTVRIKDIGHVLEARENQLMGFGLVVGLRNSGDRRQTGFTQQALTNLLSRMGVVPQSVDFRSRNVAAVMVTATLPPFVKVGQKIDVTVSSVGDATSLQGGTLLITPLKGVDDKVYAVAQGNLIIGVESDRPSIPHVKQRHTTVGRIASGALVETEVPVSLGKEGGLSIVLDEPDFTTANRVAVSIRRIGLDALARDAATVAVPIPADREVIELLSQIENLTVIPDSVARIIINERTGTVVIGENVKIAPVAISYSGIDVMIGDVTLFSEGTAADSTAEETRYRASSLARLEKKESRLREIPAGTTLSSLVSALNIIGASPRDLISILQAMKKVGAIKAELEVI